MKSIIPGIILVLNFSVLYAQQYSFKDFSSLDGLSQDQVNTVYQDSRGFVWIGTRVGLNCYDGQKFIAYGMQHGLPHQYIASVREDHKGYVWVLTRKGFSRFDGRRWMHFPAREDVEYYGMLDLQLIDEKYLLVNAVNPLPVFNIEGTYLKLEDRWPELKNLSYSEIYYQMIDSSLIYFDRASSGIGRYSNGSTNFYSFEDNSYTNKLYCQDSVVYLARQSSTELILYAFQGDSLYQILQTDSTKHTVESLLELDLFYSFNDWVYMYDSRAQIQKKVKFLGNDKLGRDLQFRSKHKEAFIQTTGVSHFLSNKFLNYTALRKPWGMVMDSVGTIWVGLQQEGAGLLTINGSQIDVRNFPKCGSLGNENMVTPEFYMGFNKDDKGRLYFSHGAGLLRLDKNCLEELLPPNFPVLNTLFDPKRKSMIAASRKGVFVIDSSGNRTYISQSDGIHANSFIVSLGMDSRNRYWFGSFNGLTCWDPDIQKVVYNYSVKTYESVLGGGVISMLNDSRGNLWFGTANGLARLDPEIDLILTVGRKEMPVYCNGMISTNDGKSMLISSQYGLYRFDLSNYYDNKTIRYEFYNQFTGFMARSPIQNNMILDTKGRVWLGSADYLVVFDPTTDDLIARELSPRITAVNGKKMPFVNELEETVFKLKNNNISISFDALGFARPRETVFSYILEGYDQDWSEWTTHTVANYTKLPNGDYTFRVRTSGNKVFFKSDEEACIELIVRASFFQQPVFPFVAGSFILLSLLALGIVSYSTYRSRLSIRKKENENALLRIQTLQSQMNPHFIFNSLSSIQHLVLTEERRKASDYLAEFSKMVRLFLQSSFKANKIGNKKEMFFSVSLVEEFELITTYLKLEQLIYPERFQWCIDIDEKLELNDIFIPPLLIQPFVENAIKHGMIKGSDTIGELLVRFKLVGEGDLLISIEDNGPGFNSEGLLRSEDRTTHESLGIKLVVDRIKLLNQLGYEIDLVFKSVPEKGTKVLLTFKNIVEV